MNIHRRVRNEPDVRPRNEPDVAFRFDHTASAARQARRLVDQILGQADEHLAWDVALVTSEMVSNVVAHTGDGGLLNAWDTNPFRVEVHDTSHVIPRMRTKADELGGRGLGIVDTLATTWGARETSDGKVVWAEFNRPAIALPSAGVRRGA